LFELFLSVILKL